MKRSALVERATTDEEEDLESWGDSDSETDEPETQEELPTVEEANKQFDEEKSEKPEAKKPEEKKQEEKKESEEIKTQDTSSNSQKSEKNTVTEELKDAAKEEEPAPAAATRQESQTPLSNPDSKESWTAVDKSESDDWEREFDLEMTEEEIEKALKNEVSPMKIPLKFLKLYFKKNETSKNKKEDDDDGELDDWSDDEWAHYCMNSIST